MDGCFTKTTSTVQALTLLGRFEKLNIPRLNIEDKYAKILHQYGDEVEEIRKVLIRFCS